MYNENDLIVQTLLRQIPDKVYPIHEQSYV